MIPYIHVPDLKVGPLTLHPFGLLVATGVILGTYLATRRARQRGLDLEKLNSFITWMLIGGFLGGHMLDQIFYHWPEFVKRPWSIFLLYEGLSSFGGFIGAFIGITLWKYYETAPLARVPGIGFTIPKFAKREMAMPILPFADVILSVFPVAWAFGRSGCASVHDHPGMKADPGSLLAVAFGRPDHVDKLVRLGTQPGGLPDYLELRWGNAPQFDLGLLEMMFTVILATLLALTWRKKLTTGAYVAATSLCYAPVRFAMDFLRVRDVDQADPRYGMLTPAQWMCVVLFLFGIAMLFRIRQIKASGRDPMDLVAMPREEPLPAEAPYRQSA